MPFFFYLADFSLSPVVNGATVDDSLEAMSSVMEKDAASSSLEDVEYLGHLANSPPSPCHQSDSPWTKGYKRDLFQFKSFPGMCFCPLVDLDQ